MLKVAHSSPPRAKYYPWAQASAAALVGKQIARLWTLPDGSENWFVGSVKSYRREQGDNGEEDYMLLVAYDDGDTEELTVRIRGRNERAACEQSPESP